MKPMRRRSGMRRRRRPTRAKGRRHEPPSFRQSRRRPWRPGESDDLLLLRHLVREYRASGESAGPLGGGGEQTVWRMPGDAASMRIAGEDGVVLWPVYVPEGSVAQLKRFQLAFQAAISVMPEGSWLNVTINGKGIGRVPIAAPKSIKVLDFDIPPGLLAAGWNAVQVSVTERHRVDCSIDATFELWTQLDPARTGLVG